MSLIIIGLVVTAAVSVGLAFYKHGSLQNVLASAKREAENLEALASKVEADAKTDYAAIIARLKTLGL